MARISDPDKLSRSTQASTGTPTGNVYFDLTNLTIELISTTDGFNPSSPANELLDQGGDNGGVDLQALYSFIKEMWKSEADLVKYPFPMEAITSEQFEFRNGWLLTKGGALVDSTKYIRNGGWAERNAGGTITKEYMGVITLGNIETNHTVYYAFAGDTAKTDFSYTGRVNEPVLVYDATVSPIVDKRSTVQTVFIRSAPEGTPGNVTGFTYDQASTTDIGVSTITTQVYRFPLAEGVDSNISLLDYEITGSPHATVFDDMRIEYYSTPQSITDTGTAFNVGVVIDSNIDDGASVPTLAQIYMWTQLQLRSAGDINTAPGDETAQHYGVLADPLVEFVGATLKTLRQSDNDGVFIEGVGNDFRNNVEFVDNTGSAQSYPFNVSVTLNFNSNMVDDANAKYFLFYTTIPEVSPDLVFGTSTAQLVSRSDGAISPDPDVVGFLHDTDATGVTGVISGSGASCTGGAYVMTYAAGSPDWVVNELAGKVLVITTGNNAGRYFIASNTATTVTIASDVAFDVTDSSMDFEIKDKNTAGTYNFIYDYTGNTDGGRTPDSDASVTLVGLGLHRAQYALATGTIEKVNTVAITLVAPLERNYNDPVGI